MEGTGSALGGSAMTVALHRQIDLYDNANDTVFDWSDITDYAPTLPGSNVAANDDGIV
jgi:hypothetical protein